MPSPSGQVPPFTPRGLLHSGAISPAEGHLIKVLISRGDLDELAASTRRSPRFSRGERGEEERDRDDEFVETSSRLHNFFASRSPPLPPISARSPRFPVHRWGAEAAPCRLL